MSASQQVGCSECKIKNLKRYNKLIAKVKKSARSELKEKSDWQRQLLASTLESEPFFKEAAKLSLFKQSFVPTIDYTVGRREFRKKWEKSGLPVMIKGAMDNWPAMHSNGHSTSRCHRESDDNRWTVQNLLSRYRNEKFKVGEDDHGKVVYLGLKYYFHYALCDDGVVDDSPLYIFDANFGKRNWHHSARRPAPKKKGVQECSDLTTDEEKETYVEAKTNAKRRRRRKKKDHKYDPNTSQATCHLVDDYVVPKYFEYDLFSLVGGRRPPFRWIVIGPARSGTGIHVDPLGTSAWNSLISGHKRWCMFPPTADKSIINPKLSDHEASTWFAQVYPKLHLPFEENPLMSVGQQMGMVEAIQGPGDTMFVPGGWHHIVMNLDFAIAVTQNFCSVSNVESVYLKTRYARPKLASTLERVLRESDQKRVRSKKQVKRMRRCADDLAGLKSVPPLDTSSSDSSSSSSSTETGTDSDAHVICHCHGRKRRNVHD